MAQTFFFYDLETSGLNPREDRIMQFAGQRTDMDLSPIGQPVNELIALNDDTIPNPEALMVTGITPQKTVEEGFLEAEFSKKLIEEYFTPDTIIVGFNNLRFDDEFIRYLLWRNFYDPYEWSWTEGRSRWDLLDVVRMTRALRPNGINWPVDADGKATNRLELLTKLNGIAHLNAHDALSDISATIEVARLIKSKQPQMFNYLFNLRHKKAVKELVNLEHKQPFVYTSGRYQQEHNKTTVAFPLTSAPHQNIIVYDLRYDPQPFLQLGLADLEKSLFPDTEQRLSSDFLPVPVKILQYNRCPAVAPIGVLEREDGWQNIGLTATTVDKHLKRLVENPDFAEKLRTVYENRPTFLAGSDPEAKLYDDFLTDIDKLRLEAVRQADEQRLADFHPEFKDERLPELLLHYKARNFPRSLSETEMISWEEWRDNRLHGQLASAMESINRLQGQDMTVDQAYVLSELQLWIEGILPGID